MKHIGRFPQGAKGIPDLDIHRVDMWMKNFLHTQHVVV